jgi:hypothetical protein
MINISGGVCGTFGVTGSISSYGATGSVGSIGITGHRGQPGVPGVIQINMGDIAYKEALFYCKKTYGFFEEDRYYTFLFYQGFGLYDIKSKDSKCNFTISNDLMSEHFIWGPELRDKKLNQIFTTSL